uniref:Exostosin GT47 domain-containing protein n=1 Tax=viral metagenome TaxID=1070528 RepID=A0A6C0LYQ4_9ZZZZ
MSYEECIKNYKLFWQYPVITEKTFYEQNKHIDNYVAFPWASIKDSGYDLQVIYKILKPYIKTKINFTCCQHISFRKFINLFKMLDIKIVYAPHKIIGEDEINGVKILPCPLFAVNFEDKTMNKLFQNLNKNDFINKKREYLYSFQGAYRERWYLTDVRKRIFEMKHPENTYINYIGQWHFENIVYNKKQNNKGELNIDDKHIKNKEEYNQLLLKSRFTLCPSGSGPNSIRFWESLAVGSIPILLADTLDLPKHVLWDEAIVRVKEADLKKIPNILKDIDFSKEKIMRENCIKIYNHFKNNYRNI